MSRRIDLHNDRDYAARWESHILSELAKAHAFTQQLVAEIGCWSVLGLDLHELPDTGDIVWLRFLPPHADSSGNESSAVEITPLDGDYWHVTHHVEDPGSADTVLVYHQRGASGEVLVDLTGHLRSGNHLPSSV